MESDSEEEEEEQNLYEVDGVEKGVDEEEEEAPSPEAPEIIEPEHGVNLLRRNNSRKFKTPSFKWKKKKKNREPEPYLAPPSPSAPEMSVTEDLADMTVDDNLEIEPAVEEEEEVGYKVSVDSLNNKLQEKEEEINTAAAANDGEAERLAKEAEFFQERLREAEELLSRYKTDNMMLHQRVEMAERDRGAMEHGNYVELEKVRDEYQEKLNELALYPEKLSSAEARYQHAEAQTEALQSQLADKNQTVEELQKKIGTFQGQIGKLKEKIHAVNEDNIELSNKSQSHERKVLEADLHNKNLMDLVSKKDDAVESHQPLDVDAQIANLPPPPASPSTDNNLSEKGEVEESGSETGSSDSESEEEVDWSDMLKNAEANRERLGLDNVSDGESTEDEDGNRVPKKKEQNGLTTQDLMNRMATNQLMGYDEFGRPLNGKYNGAMMSGRKGAKNRNMLFGGMDGGKRTHKSGSNNKGAGRKDRSSRSGGRRAKKGGGGMALLGF